MAFIRNTGHTQALKDNEAFLAAAWTKFNADSKISNLELRIASTSDKYVSLDAYFVPKSDFIIAIVKDISKAKEHLNYIIEFGA